MPEPGPIRQALFAEQRAFRLAQSQIEARQIACGRRLRSVGALTRLSDPLAIPEEVAALSPSLFFREPYSAVEGADIALVMTPTRDYRNLDFARLARSMKTPLLFDTCNILVPAEEKIRSSGLRYLRIGV